MPPKKSLRKRFLLQQVSIILALLLSIIAVVAIMLKDTLTIELNKDLKVSNEGCINKLQDRISSLFESASNFSRNPIVIESMVNYHKKLDSLPKLMDHFVIKDTHSVTMLNFDKSLIYSTLHNPPDYPSTRYLKIVMTVGEARFYVSDNKNLVYIVPIYLYKNIQGVIIIEYNLVSIFDSILPNDPFFYRLYANDVKITEKNFKAKSSYITLRSQVNKGSFILDKLKISVELGALRSHYRVFIWNAIFKLLAVGICFIIVAVAITIRMGDSMCKPILTLCERVEKSAEGFVKCSPLGTDDELESLADVFDKRTELLLNNNERLQAEIVQRKNAEASLKRAYDDLELRVQQRTAELAAAKEAAEVSATVKATFLANMSHEIRTPMNTILGFLEMLIEDYNLPEPDRKRYLNITRNSARSLLGLLNDILDVSKIESGKMALELRPFNLRDVLHSVYQMFDVKVHEKGLDFTYGIDPSIDCNFIGDPLRLRQVIINLAGNAVKFTERGSIRIEVHPEEDLIRFDVIDTGIGISTEGIERIFDAFTQADDSTTRRFGGTGLGTTISKQLIEMMGGRIWVDSTVGTGSTFHFTVNIHKTDKDPIYLAQDIDAAGENIPLTRPHRVFRILVAEDLDENIVLLKTQLEHQGHTVVVAKNGIEAIERFKNDHVDLILMDIQMPHMDGLQATRHIRALNTQSSAADIPIIALTAGVMTQEIDSYLQEGINAVIAKPVDFDRLFDTIEKITPEGVGRMFVEALAEASVEASLATDFPALEGIDVGTAIDRWQVPRVYIGALIGFSAKYGNAAREISALLDDNDIETAARIAHSLKSLSGNLSMPQVYEVCCALEHSLNEGDIDQGRELLKPLATALETVVVSIGRLDAQEQAAGQLRAETDMEKIREILVLLMQSFEEYSPDEIEPLIMDLEWYVNTEQSGQLKKYIDELDFTRARLQMIQFATTLGIDIENAYNQYIGKEYCKQYTGGLN
ncbi:multi-sensor hybrid histidine kinase [Candidatus Magnetobacterium bavaricum]|uniref:histidine kinase n=1 Tax=Candidatus Magnetobacterium bavaricum TaxID=29290 RepID=A0A0F3GMQ6_9BACT|nr:multi-sensor hybrid histidine kinase [Candidatus Magnetobacterium bavaricum]